MRQPLSLLLCALLLCQKAEAAADFSPTGRALHTDDGNFPHRDHMKQGERVLPPEPASTFNLKVQVRDMLSHQSLSQAEVEVYINYTRTSTALTGEDGSVLLHVPYQTGLPVTVVASKNGYIYTLLPCETSRIPIFSSVTMSLLGLNQGNIWLFEDSFVITGKTSDAPLQPVVQFPKSLLNLTDSSDLTSFKAYLTIPKLPAEENNFLNTLGIMSSKSGYVTVELNPVAAVSVQLFLRDKELNVSGPVHFSLTLPDNCGLQASNAVPAWFYNRTTGGWMRKGLGTVVSVDGKLRWTFTAPHLGYWIAAPLSPTRGVFGLAILIDFILHHSPFLMVLLGGALFIIICLLVVLLFYRRSSPSEIKTKKILPVTTKDQTTSTCDNEAFEVSLGDTSHSQDELSQSFAERKDNQHNVSIYNGNVITNPIAVAVKLECAEFYLNTEANGLTAEERRVPVALTDNQFLYNLPVAVLQLEEPLEQLEQPQRSKSATLPRAGASNGAAAEPQTEGKGSSATQTQAAETGDRLGVLEDRQASASNSSRSQYGLPESASVPGTLNKIRDNRHSVHALGELSKIPSLQPPRAWFVSLEGKPAAEIHYSVSEQQRRRRPVESRETSLDSGVDMSELNQTSGRRTVTLERNVTFVKSKHAPL